MSVSEAGIIEKCAEAGEEEGSKGTLENRESVISQGLVKSTSKF